jgi:hypothetical protein
MNRRREAASTIMAITKRASRRLMAQVSTSTDLTDEQAPKTIHALTAGTPLSDDAHSSADQ